MAVQVGIAVGYIVEDRHLTRLVWSLMRPALVGSKLWGWAGGLLTGCLFETGANHP